MVKWAPIALANVVILGILVWAAQLESADPGAYYRSLQEDGTLEWSTFWAFLLAGAANATAALWQRRQEGRFPWFSLGVGLFCFVVAMEEISWGQRVLGFQPPVYFLANNYQQELNFHNIVDTDIRKFAVNSIIAGYGIALPLAMLIPLVRRWLGRLGIIAPPVGLVPGFAGALVAYQIYPWQFTGEIVEWMLGLGFLFAAALHGIDLRGSSEASASGAVRRLAVVAGCAAAVSLLGMANEAWSRSRRSVDPGALEEARIELDALRRDVDAQKRRRGGRLPFRCGIHKRLYGVVLHNDGQFLRTGAFVDLIDRGLPEHRADYLIDPWSTAYWVRRECAKDSERESLFLYSFGPNRLRDSSEWEILGDDIGVYIVLRKAP